MPDLRIKDFTGTATTPLLPGTYVETDHATNGGQKLDLPVYIEPLAATKSAGWDSFFFDGVVTTQRVYWPTPAAAVIGTSDFTVVLPIRGLARRSGQTSGLWMLTAQADGGGYAAGSFTVRIDAIDQLRIQIGADTDYRRYVVPAASFWNLYQGRTGDLVVRRSSGVISVDWVEGRMITSITLPSEITLGTPPAWSGSLSNAAFVVGSMFTGAQYSGELGAPLLIPRSWQTAELAYWAIHRRLSAADAIGGSMTAQTSGLLAIGARYRITAAGGTFTGVGSADNNVGTEFVATATTPTWSTGAVIAIGALIQPEITRSAQVVDKGPLRIRGIMTSGVRPLCDCDPEPVDFTLTTTGAFVTGGSTNPLWFEPGMIDRVNALASTAGADITLRRNSSSTNDIVSAVTDIPNANIWVPLTIIDAQRIFASGETLWGLASTGTIQIRLFWTRN